MYSDHLKTMYFFKAVITISFETFNETHKLVVFDDRVQLFRLTNN